MVLKRNYENLPIHVQQMINEKLERLSELSSVTTIRERQYMFLRWLDTLPITDSQVFYIYTNTEVV